jgi:hypothetical protein
LLEKQRNNIALILVLYVDDNKSQVLGQGASYFTNQTADYTKQKKMVFRTEIFIYRNNVNKTTISFFLLLHKKKRSFPSL